MTIPLDGKVLLAGAGRMGSAMLEGWLERGMGAAKVVVQEPSPQPDIAAILARSGVEHRREPAPMEVPPAVIVVAVKPQAMDQVFPPLAALAGPGTLVLSIAAGRTLASFERHLPTRAAVVRAMPNTPAAIGRGITVCVANAHVSTEQRSLATSLLEAVGEVGWVEDEAHMDAVTAVSGSGPAYVFLLAEALAAAGVRAGLDPALSERLSRATVAGAGELLHRSRESAAQLRHNVTSPGGTTAAALGVLMRDRTGLVDLMVEAVEAAKKRGRELAG
ncbi:MAG: pyrroline-5-carboxylate reductase [Hyphomicrobiaceae bacterium]